MTKFVYLINKSKLTFRFLSTFIDPLDPAMIVKLPSEYAVAAKESLSLHCQAEGNPQPSYTWTPCESQQCVCHESRHNISEVVNNGIYTCKVTNFLGTDARITSVGRFVCRSIWRFLWDTRSCGPASSPSAERTSPITRHEWHKINSKKQSVPCTTKERRLATRTAVTPLLMRYSRS